MGNYSVSCQAETHILPRDVMRRSWQAKSCRGRCRPTLPGPRGQRTKHKCLLRQPEEVTKHISFFSYPPHPPKPFPHPLIPLDPPHLPINANQASGGLMWWEGLGLGPPGYRSQLASPPYLSGPGLSLLCTTEESKERSSKPAYALPTPRPAVAEGHSGNYYLLDVCLISSYSSWLAIVGPKGWRRMRAVEGASGLVSEGIFPN
ncbi:hypothetical protein EYF80_028118 [Liparis tanakae]|uniref:Uncharacterized protein n=1 Tax=Liparis tanakae TaxID=230148 RepID=A0A4Z2H6Y2_9TELE|nr:hypothetical protein EYF80_028118 [Liparis tanakae]